MKMRSPLSGADSARLRGCYSRVDYRNVKVRRIVYGQTCPRCKAVRLALKLNNKSKTSFWGCGSWPNCSFTRDLTPDEEVQFGVPLSERRSRNHV